MVKMSSSRGFRAQAGPCETTSLPASMGFLDLVFLLILWERRRRRRGDLCGVRRWPVLPTPWARPWRCTPTSTRSTSGVSSRRTIEYLQYNILAFYSKYSNVESEIYHVSSNYYLRQKYLALIGPVYLPALDLTKNRFHLNLEDESQYS